MLSLGQFHRKGWHCNSLRIRTQSTETVTHVGARSFRSAVFTLLTTVCALCGDPAHAYLVQFKEQFYRLYHTHLHQYPDEVIENIHWLERAVHADFANPLYALAPIRDKKSWEKYRALFMMHLNLKLTEQHLRLGEKFDKREALFFNAPWREENIESLATAERCYHTARRYWHEAALWAERANADQFRFLFLTELPAWEDERERIARGTLNYARTISRELARLEAVRARFMEMNDTY